MRRAHIWARAYTPVKCGGPIYGPGRERSQSSLSSLAKAYALAFLWTRTKIKSCRVSLSWWILLLTSMLSSQGRFSRVADRVQLLPLQTILECSCEESYVRYITKADGYTAQQLFLHCTSVAIHSYFSLGRV